MTTRDDLALANRLADAAGEAIRPFFRARYDMEIKADKSPVTEADRAAEAAITALLVHLGALPEADPVVERYLTAPIRNWRGMVTGQMRRATAFPA